MKTISDKEIGQHFRAALDDNDDLVLGLIRFVIEERARINSNGPNGMHYYHSEKCDCLKRTLEQYNITPDEWEKAKLKFD